MADRDLPAGFLDLAVEPGVRLVAVGLLHEAENARERLVDPDDDEALHDFRVAIRRLRSWMRAFRDYLDSSIKRRDRQRLKALAHSTSSARDVQVQLEWLEKREAEFDELQQAGVSRYRRHLERCEKEAQADLRSEVARDFGHVARRLEKSLPWYVVSGRIDETLRSVPIRLAVARAVERTNRELGNRLKRVRSIADGRAAHEARIAGKRLRYTIEPISALVPGSGEVVDQLKALQDVVGDLHDAVVLLNDVVTVTESTPSEDAAHAGLVALTAKLRDRVTVAFAVLEHGWLDGQGESLVLRVAELARDLTEDVGSDQEIERKYLLRAVPEEARSGAVREIEQGYLPGKRVSERLRRVKEGRAIRRYRTVKAGSGLVRTEVEEETTAKVFNTMWPLTAGRRVHKTRYVVPDDGHVWEIDEFRDRELVLAEIELPTADEAVEPPSWLAPFIVREVTGEPGYDNAKLAK